MTSQTLAISGGTPSAIRQHYYSRKIKMYLFVIILLALTMGFYGIEKYLELSEKTTITNQSQNFLDELEKTRQTERDQYLEIKESNKETAEKIDKEIVSVFPPREQYTELTRLLDGFFKKYNRANDPIVATDLQFEQPHEDTNKQYVVLPFSVSIESSEDNFYRFLAYIETSGSLAGKVRLMDAQSIALSFPEDDEGTGGKKRIRFSAQLQAYSQLTTDN